MKRRAKLFVSKYLSLIYPDAHTYGQRLRRPAKNTKTKTMRRVRSMMRDLRPALLATCESLLESGVVDVESFPDNARLAKLVLVAALRRVDCFSPPAHDKEGWADIKNLTHS